MLNSERKNRSNSELWLAAQKASPYKMAGYLKELHSRQWAPEGILEKEWFDELLNLCLPLDLEVFANVLDENVYTGDLEGILKNTGMLPVIKPLHSGGSYSMRISSTGRCLTHSPASAGLIQGWALPFCRESFQMRLYSRRSSFESSRDCKLAAAKNENDLLVVYDLAESKKLKSFKHPASDLGNSYSILKFIGREELLVADRSDQIHFLPLQDREEKVYRSDRSYRSYKGLLFRQRLPLAASDDGELILTPDYGKKPSTIWKLPEKEVFMNFDKNTLPAMKALFSPDGNYLVTSDAIGQLQLRAYPFSDLLFSMELGREIEQPLLAISHDSALLACLKRSHPVDLHIISLVQGKHLKKLSLPEQFSRHLIIDIAFAASNNELLLAGKESVYVLDLLKKSSRLSNTLLFKLANTPVREFLDRDLKMLEASIQKSWHSIHLKPWVEMLIYLVRRRSYDIEISECQEQEQYSRFDIEIS